MPQRVVGGGRGIVGLVRARLGVGVVCYVCGGIVCLWFGRRRGGGVGCGRKMLWTGVVVVEGTDRWVALMLGWKYLRFASRVCRSRNRGMLHRIKAPKSK